MLNRTSVFSKASEFHFSYLLRDYYAFYFNTCPPFKCKYIFLKLDASFLKLVFSVYYKICAINCTLLPNSVSNDAPMFRAVSAHYDD